MLPSVINFAQGFFAFTDYRYRFSTERFIWPITSCKTGQAPKLWQTIVVEPIHKKRDKRKCTNYRDISLLSVTVKVYAKHLEKKCREIVEPKLTDAQCGFRPGQRTMDQIFSLQDIFRKLWEQGRRQGGQEGLPPPQSTCLASPINKLTLLKTSASVFNFKLCPLLINALPPKSTAPPWALLWEYAKQMNACFVHLEKAFYDRIMITSFRR